MLTLASMTEIKSVGLCQLGFRATWDCTNPTALVLWLAPTHQAVPVQPSLTAEWLYVTGEGLPGEGSGCTTGSLCGRKQRTCHAHLAVWRRKAAQQGCFLCSAAGQCKVQSRDYRNCSYAGLIWPFMLWGVPILQSRMCSSRFDWGIKQWGTEESKAQHLAAAKKTREVQARADSTVLVAAEPEVWAMRCYCPAEAPLTPSECTSKTCHRDTMLIGLQSCCPYEQQPNKLH